MAKAPGSSVAAYLLEIDGKAAGFVSRFTAPTLEAAPVASLGPGGQKSMPSPMKVSDAAITCSLAQSGPFADCVSDFLRGKASARNVSVLVVDQRTIKWRVDMASCLLSAVEFSPLDASSAKEPLTVTVRLQPDSVTFASVNATGTTLPSAVKPWLAGNFQVNIPGLDSRYVSRVTLPTITARVASPPNPVGRRPVRAYTVFDLGDLETEHVAGGIGAARDLAIKTLQDGQVTDDEYIDMTVDVLDAALKKVVASFALTVAPRRFAWSTDTGGNPLGTVQLGYDVGDFTLDRKSV